MKTAPLPENEEQRLRLLEQLEILDTDEEQAYDDLTYLAAQICGTPIALVSLLDPERQWFKSHYGLDVREAPRELAICAHAILGDGLFLVEDADQDERFADNPLVTGGPMLKFYAGEPLVLHDDLKVGTLCVIDDHARRLSDAQKQSLKALARQVVSQLELRLHLRELQELDEAKNEFISMVNHELRTPLTSIKGSLGILNDQLVKTSADEKLQQLSSIALRNTDQLLNIVNDILDVAKLEAGKMQLRLQPLDLAVLLEKAVELNQAFVDKCDCRLSLSMDESIRDVQLLGDEQRLIQVLNNLISNAAKFTYAGDVIEVAARVSDDKAHVTVTDHGCGIAEADQKLLFLRFEQLSNQGNAKFPGTGLGLNICKHIIDLHGGEIGFEDEPGVSTTFWFELPLTPQ